MKFWWREKRTREICPSSSAYNLTTDNVLIVCNPCNFLFKTQFPNPSPLPIFLIVMNNLLFLSSMKLQNYQKKKS